MHPDLHKITPQHTIAFTLRRQHLVQPAKNPLNVVRDLVAIQAQYTASVPLAIWARCQDLSPAWVDEALFETKKLVKTWCLRGTVHVLASADLSLFVQSIGHQQRREYRKFMETRRGIDSQQIKKMEELILAALGERTLTRSELHGAIPELASIPGASWGLDVRGLAFTGDVIFAGSEGAESRFVRREVWLPNLKWVLPAGGEARRELLLHYLAAYGPATPQDFAHWTGLKMNEVKVIFEACEPDLCQVEVAGWGKNYHVVRQDELTLKNHDEIIPEICLLPKFDPLLVAYRNKTRFIDQENLTEVYRPAGHIEAIVLLHGRAAATWRMNQRGKRLHLTISPLRTLNKSEQSLVNNTGERLASFLGARELNLVFAERKKA